MNPPLAGHVRKPESVLVRQLGNESVLLNLESEAYFGLDEVGSRMWAALEKGGTLQHAYDTLIEEYEVDPVRLRSDLMAFVDRLVEAGLVEVVDG